MNRTDEIQAKARDIASNVHLDLDARNAMADQLIELCCLILGAVGKSVASEGEGAISDAEQASDAAKAHNRYLLGEQLMEASRWVTAEATNPEVDLERWREITPGTGCRCGHVPRVHQDGVCTGEQFNHEPCEGGPCTGFVHREPTGGWVHVDRRPATLPAVPVTARPSACTCNPMKLVGPATGVETLRHAFGCPALGPVDCTCAYLETDDGIRHHRDCRLYGRNDAGHDHQPGPYAKDLCAVCGLSLGPVCETCGRSPGHQLGCPETPPLCCKPDGECVLHHSGRPAPGGCCYLKSEVCPEHH